MGSRTLVFFKRIRNVILQKKPRGGNTDTRICRNVIFKENFGREIATDEFGWGDDTKDFPKYTEMVSDGGMAAKFRS